MGDLHELIRRHGLELARAQAVTRGQRAAVDAAGDVLAEEVSRLGITHAGFAMTALPHKRFDERVWRREGPQTILLVESGSNDNGALLGVPYGSIARLILLYLQTEAIRTNSPEVELGRSMNTWLGRMGLTIGGRTYKLVAEQARRISACRLTFFTSHTPGLRHRQNGAFVQDEITMTGLADRRQPTIWQDRVRLDDAFWRSLRKHPVPVREEAIKAIGTRSLAIDIYIWLAYRLHVLDRPTPVSWSSLHAQFGQGFRHAYDMKPRFREAMAIALAVYPEARVTEIDGGITLYPSPSAIPAAEARRLGLG